MNLTPILSDFSFIEVLSLTLIVVGAIVYLVLSVIQHGFIFKNLSIGSTKKNTSRSNNNTDVLMLLEALKIKDDLARVDRIVWQRQKIKAREVVNKSHSLQLKHMKRLIRETFDLNEYEVLNSHDYLYYSLMVEKMYSQIFASMLERFEQNSLANIPDPQRYAEERSQVSVDAAFSTTVDSFYAGMTNIDRKEHDKMYESIYNEILNNIREAYADGVFVAKQGQEKKEDLKAFVFEKVDTMDGISRGQIENFFSGIVAEDFLNVQR